MRRFGVLLRAGLSLFLLAWVVSRAEWSGVLDHLDDADWRYLALFLLITPVNVAVSVYKWRLLLAARGFTLPFGGLFKMYVASQFYNNVLPSSVGGDVVRVMMLNRVMDKPDQALSSIVMERLTGLVVLMLIGSIAAIGVAELRSNVTLMALVALSIMGSLAVFASVLSTRLVSLLTRLLGRWRAAERLLGKAQGFQSAMHDYRDHPGVVAVSLVLSLLFYAGAVLNIWLACAGIGQPIPIATTAVVVPVVLLVSLLPFTVGGLGLAEWTFMVGFEALGSPGALGVAAGLLLRAKQVIWTSGGHVWYLVSAGRVSVRDPAAMPASSE